MFFKEKHKTSRREAGTAVLQQHRAAVYCFSSIASTGLRLCSSLRHAATSLRLCSSLQTAAATTSLQQARSQFVTYCIAANLLAASCFAAAAEKRVASPQFGGGVVFLLTR